MSAAQTIIMALIVKFALDIKTMKNAVEMGNAR